VSAVANVSLNLDTRGVPQKLRDVQNQAQQTERAFSSLNNTVGQLVRAYAAFQAIKFVFTQTAELESQTKSLQVLTGSVEKATQIIKELQAIGAVTPFTSAELIDSAKRLQAFGVETNKVVDTTRRLADVSGATGAELQGLVTAYGQVQAKGRLQGEELLQFQERGVALQKVLRDEYKLSGSEFQKALEKGQISAQAVEYAIQKLTDAGGKYANGAIAQSETLQGKLSTLQDSFQRLAQNIGKFFEPVFKFLIDGVNALLERLNNATRIGAEARAYQEANQRTRAKFGARAVNPFDTEVQQYRERLRRSLVTVEMGGTGIPKAPKGTAKLPPLLAPSAGGGGGAGKSAANEAKRLQEELQRSVEQGDRLGREYSRQILQLSAITEAEQERNRIQFEYEDRSLDIKELKNQEQRTNLITLNDEIKRLQLKKFETEELKKQNEEFYKRVGLTAQIFGAGATGGTSAFRTDVDLLGQQDKALQAVLEKYPLIGQAAAAAGQMVTAGTMEMISGTKTAEQVFSEFLNNIADMLIKTAAQMIAQYIAIGIARMFAGFGGTAITNAGSSFGPAAFSMQGPGVTGFGLQQLIPGRAAGGPVGANKPYVVGERGPELFVPGSSGNIIPNNQMGSSTNVVVNVDASGSNVQGNGDEASQLGKAIGIAVQQELIKQKRPGGLLAGV